jgi:hypothetical protein
MPPNSLQIIGMTTERGGFEPPMDGTPIPVFETGAFNRSATSPVRGPTS